MRRKRVGCGIVTGSLFLYNNTVKGENRMDSYDNDALLLILDDDLFFIDEEDDERSESDA